MTRAVKVNRKTMLDIVNEVKKRPCLWDTDDEYYHNRGRVSVAWEDIRAALNLPEALIRAKWKNIRDIFKREMKRCKYNKNGEFEYTGKWRHMKLMLFLHKQHLTPSVQEKNAYEKDTSDSSTEPNIKQELPMIMNSNRDGESDENMPFEASNIFSVDYQPEDPLPNAIARRSLEEDYDMMFLKSLVPYFRELDPIRKLKVRNKIQDIILNEINEQGAFSNSTR